MKTLEILLIVDTERVLTSNTLIDSVEMVTNNKYSEYHNETKNEIHSICFADELIKWRAVCKVTGKIIEIEGFNGEMIDEKVCIPRKRLKNSPEWSGRVNFMNDEQTGTYEYRCFLSIYGKSMPLDLYLEVLNPEKYRPNFLPRINKGNVFVM